MRDNSRLIFHLLSCLLAVLSSTTHAWELSSHDVTRTAENQYQVTGPDPYFQFENSIARAEDGYWLSVHLKGAKKSNRRSHMQIYWADSATEISTTRMMSAGLQNGANRVYLPVSLLESNGSAVRLDLENCQKCVVEIQSPVADSLPSSSDSFPDGFDQYQRIYQGFDIAIGDWFGQELNSPQPGRFTFSGWDPKIINSTRISLPADRAAGLYLEFDYNSVGKFQTYELFWYLQGLPWNALRSAHFILENDGNPRKQIFLPFDRIGSSRVLNHLRFDFEACESCELSLIKTRIIGTSELANYAQFTPERLYYVHTEVPPGRKIMANFGRKLIKDWGFLLFWLALLLGSTTIGIRKVRALGN